MNDRPAPSPSFEDWLAAELQRVAAIADDPRPPALVTQEVLRHRRGRRVAARYRRGTPLLGLAAALSLPAALLVVGSQPPSPTPAHPFTWEALLVRDAGSAVVDVVIVDQDGTERTIRTIDGQDRTSVPDPVGYYYPHDHLASTDGWLAVFGHVWYGLDEGPSSLADAWQLVDLTDPGRPARTVFAGGRDEGGPIDTVAWGPDGRFARMCAGTSGCMWYHDPRHEGLRDANGTIRVVSPAVDGSMTIEGLAPGDLPLAWTADGHALAGAGSDRSALAVVDRRTVSDSVSRLAWRPGPRLVTESGMRLAPGSTQTIGRDGTRIDWHDVRPHAAIQAGSSSTTAVSLAADGASVWLLAGDTRRAALVHATGPDELVVVATFGSPTPLADGAATATLAFAGLAPDDSVIVVRAEAGYRRYGGDQPIAIVRTDDGSVSRHEGWFAGFVPEGLFAVTAKETPG